jgi:hypothetical protein
MKDLFENPELIPTNVMLILNSINDEIDTYKELSRILIEVEKLGYTFDYGLDAEPYGLRLISVKLTDLIGFETK